MHSFQETGVDVSAQLQKVTKLIENLTQRIGQLKLRMTGAGWSKTPEAVRKAETEKVGTSPHTQSCFHLQSSFLGCVCDCPTAVRHIGKGAGGPPGRPRAGALAREEVMARCGVGLNAMEGYHFLGFLLLWRFRATFAPVTPNLGMSLSSSAS